jgi:hypothetical protein
MRRVEIQRVQNICIYEPTIKDVRLNRRKVFRRIGKPCLDIGYNELGADADRKLIYRDFHHIAG